MTAKFLCALQYWDQDWPEAEALGELIADLCDGRKCEVADFMLVAKRAAPDARETAARLAEVFDQVHTLRCTGIAVGYPDGPNSQAGETWRHFIRKVTDGEWNYSGLFLIEPDSVPLSRDWLERIHAEWTAALADGKLLLGHLHAHPWGARTHLNGTMLIAPEFARVAPDFPDAPTAQSWDVYNAGLTLPHAQVSRAVYNDPGSESRWDGTFAGLSACWGERHPAGHPFAGEIINPAWKTGHKNASKAHALIRQNLP